MAICKRFPSAGFLYLTVLWLMVVGCAAMGCAAQPEESIEDVILRAGNADSDAVRLQILRDLRQSSDVDDALRGDLDKVIEQIERWLGEKRLDYFGREVGRKKDFDFGLDEGSPVAPLTWLYRGRMVIWYTLESGGVWNIPERKREFMSVARGFFTKYARAFPQNRIARMYLGEPTRSNKVYTALSDAPRWAVQQRIALEQLTDIIEWWIDNRMQADGQYGGGWGDDCEMWRWQAPVLIGFDNPKVSRAQHRFSNAMMSQEHMKLGFTTRMSDVEHTAEDSADVITPMMHLDPDNELWQERALKLAEFMQTLWTGRNQRGQLQFKSTYFTADRVDSSETRACDTVYHPRAVQPALLYWQRTNDARLTELFSVWMDTWVEATARAQRGKAAGIIPSAIHWPDGDIGGVGANWWDPRNHGEYTLYLWPSAMGMMTNTMLLTHHITGEDKYLEPIRSMARIRLKYLTKDPANVPEGSESWCAERMGFLADTLAKYRFLTGSDEFDQVLAGSMSAYMRFRMEGDEATLTAALKRTAEALCVNPEGYTSEVRYTDRVLRFPTLFGPGGLAEGTESPVYRPDTSLLYSAVTGDPGGALYFPMNAVRWLTSSRNIAALVVESGRERFAAEVFNFSSQVRRMSAELYLLEEGQYTFRIAAQDSQKERVIVEKMIEVKGPRTRLSFILPAEKLCTITVNSK